MTSATGHQSLRSQRPLSDPSGTSGEPVYRITPPTTSQREGLVGTRQSLPAEPAAAWSAPVDHSLCLNVRSMHKSASTSSLSILIPHLRELNSRECMHLCVCVYIHACMYTYTCVYVYMCVCIHVCVYMYICVHVYMWDCGYTCVCLLT